MPENIGIDAQIIISLITTAGIIAVAIIQNRNNKDSKERTESVLNEQKLTHTEIAKLLRRNESVSRNRTIIETAEAEMNERSRDLAVETAKATRDGQSNGELSAAIIAFNEQRKKTRTAVARAHADMVRDTEIENLSDILENK